MNIPEFTYMRWAKRHSGAHAFDLTPSSIPFQPLPPAAEPSRNRQVPTGDGDPACERLLSDRYGVPADHILFVPGTTLGNFLLLFAHVEPGDTVLVEHPVYENLPGLVRLLGARVRSVPRPAAAEYRPDLDAVADGFAAGARALFLTDLHNPSGRRLAAADLRSLRELAAKHGAKVLVDEVYRDFLPGPVGTAYRTDSPGVVTASSLTKVYGLGALRAGWVFCPPEDRDRLVRLLDYLTVLPPAPVAASAEVALGLADDIRARGDALIREGRATLERWLRDHAEVRWCPPAGGVAGFFTVEGVLETDDLCAWLLEERDTAVIPGRFFGDPSGFRLAFGVPRATLEPALDHVAEAVARFRG